MVQVGSTTQKRRFPTSYVSLLQNTSTAPHLPPPATGTHKMAPGLGIMSDRLPRHMRLSILKKDYWWWLIINENFDQTLTLFCIVLIF